MGWVDEARDADEFDADIELLDEFKMKICLLSPYCSFNWRRISSETTFEFEFMIKASVVIGGCCCCCCCWVLRLLYEETIS
jgi:glycerol-3-phosphate cytidylyltransferase-like family protein